MDATTNDSPIPAWPVSERPREKLIAAGPEALTDAELLAVLLRSGAPGVSALALARELIRLFGGLRELLTADVATVWPPLLHAVDPPSKRRSDPTPRSAPSHSRASP